MSKKNRSNSAVLDNVKTIVVTADDITPAEAPIEAPAENVAPLNETAADQIRALVNVSKPAPWTRRVGDFTAVLESETVNTGDAALKKALDRFAERLAANDYVAALKAFDVAFKSAATMRFDPIVEVGARIDKNGNPADRVRRATSGLNRAYQMACAAGQMETGMKYMAVTIPTRTVKGVKIIGGTRLYKKF